MKIINYIIKFNRYRQNTQTDTDRRENTYRQEKDNLGMATKLYEESIQAPSSACRALIDLVETSPFIRLLTEGLFSPLGATACFFALYPPLLVVCKK